MAGQRAVRYDLTFRRKNALYGASNRATDDLEGHIERARKRAAWRDQLRELRRQGLAPPPADEP